MANDEREQLWQERVAQWQASGLSQRAYAIEQGFPVRQVGYWVRRLTKSQDAAVPVPVRLRQCLYRWRRSACAASAAGR